MRELIDEHTANVVMNALAVGLPLAGVVAGGVLGVLGRRPRAGVQVGLGTGALGVGNWMLWRAYNAITDRYGLDTVKNLAVNLALFVGIGVATGVAVGLRLRAAAGTREPAGEHTRHAE